MNAIGIDLGGTNVKVVKVTAQGTLLVSKANPIVNGDWKLSVLNALTEVKGFDQSPVYLHGPGSSRFAGW
jgi:predicted NBD/HSP70 family sugar kinase